MSPIFENKDIQGKMTVLNWKNKHLNLIVGPHHMLPQIGSMDIQYASITGTNAYPAQCNTEHNSKSSRHDDDEEPINLCDERI